MFEKRKNNDNTNLDRLTNKSDLNVTRQGNQRCYPSQRPGSFLDGRDREPQHYAEVMKTDCMTAISALQSLGQEDHHKSKAILGCETLSSKG